jgi:hypothetical protein
MKKNKIYTIFLFALLSLPGFGQKILPVSGDGFKYTIEVPEGWSADTTASSELYVNIALYETGVEEDPVYGRTLIQVYTFKKENPTPKEDLKIDIDNLMQENKKLELEDFILSVGDFKCYNRLAFVKETLYQYLAYLDPGKKYSSAVSVSMNTGRKRASDSEMKALRRIVASVKMIKG